MKTPYYQFDERVIEENFKKMSELLSPCKVFYSMKSNPNSKVTGVLSKLNARFEISSLEETKTLKQLNIEKERIYCGLPVMKEELIREIYQIGCGHFVFDSMRELKLLLILAPNAKKIMRICVTNLSDDAIGYGIKDEEMEHILEEYSMHIDGISFHISNHANLEPAINALDKIDQLLSRFNREMIVNIGGSYKLDCSEETYDKLKNKMIVMSGKYTLKWMCELGASIINTAGSVITTVISTYEQNGFIDVFIDSGIPTGVMRKPGKVINLEENRKSRRTYYRFFDTTSMKKLLFQSILREEIIENDRLQLTDYGAYSLCYSNNFHSQPKPQVRIVGRN
ncbi:hypothetical protein GOQ29_13790 [Clostridium sp. D2Q-14]|uniref:hypothetical protein n=1 Tax=Anaeromonas gelatinilytica TaxID=2683194 RepID=UPI00193B6987|nr:hypothetical protein [Anaeromonas gelatinilytica]MBS4536690.1 hypothetical protein [Anaeromonas gelatinilytica]